MDWSGLGEPLGIDQIDFRVQSINKGGYATILAYKDARVDMDRLDRVVGRGKWQRKHEIIDGQLFCSVGIYNSDIGEWVWVQDVGTESNTEKEKGRASDAFKRACFNLGIGRELYEYPVISVKLLDNEWQMREWNGKQKPTATWALQIRDWKWYAERDSSGITFLAAKDQNNKMRFQWGERGKGGDTSGSESDTPINPATPEAEFAAKLVGELHGGDTAAIYDTWRSVDNGMKEACWRYINATDRRNIKEAIKQEEANR